MATRHTGIEHKNISLRDFKILTDGPGGFAGYITTWGVLDDVGDIVLRGAYLDTREQFLKNGFVGDNHNWTYSQSPGFPISLDEDDIGAHTEMRFFSTPDSQIARVKTQERKEAGLSVALSIGYEPSAQPIFIKKSDYQTELPRYIRSDLIEETLVKAQRFDRVRVLSRLHLYEYSPVSVPALRTAEVTEVKSTDTEAEDQPAPIEQAIPIESADAVDGHVVESPDTDSDYMAHLKGLVTDLGGMINRTEARIDMRTKEGRVLSTANWTELVELYERLGKLIEAGKPKPKEDEEEKAALAAEVNAITIEYYARQARVRALLRS